ncbi:MAG: MBL fold metallo-hydrolase [Bacteroidia bacterium]|nr:MBL fold metallo-hydrolase [Bacteroidia bacterium]
MTITFLGTGTSQGVPIIACDCSVCRSADSRDKRLRSSILIENEGETYVVDTGPDFRQQMLRTAVKRLDAVIYTHEHRDHIAGLDDLRAFNFVMKRPIDIYADDQVQEAIRSREYPYIFSKEQYPGIPEIRMHRVGTEPFTIGKSTFTPIQVMHFKLPVMAYRIKNFTYITDANFISEEEQEKIKGSEIIVLNALRREHHLSHFSFREALALIEKWNPKEAYFTHISHQLGKHAEVEKELPAFVRLAYDGLVLKC